MASLAPSPPVDERPTPARSMRLWKFKMTHYRNKLKLNLFRLNFDHQVSRLVAVEAHALRDHRGGAVFGDDGRSAIAASRLEALARQDLRRPWLPFEEDPGRRG